MDSNVDSREHLGRRHRATDSHRPHERVDDARDPRGAWLFRRCGRACIVTAADADRNQWALLARQRAHGQVVQHATVDVQSAVVDDRRVQTRHPQGTADDLGERSSAMHDSPSGQQIDADTAEFLGQLLHQPPVTSAV